MITAILSPVDGAMTSTMNGVEKVFGGTASISKFGKVFKTGYKLANHYKIPLPVAAKSIFNAVSLFNETSEFYESYENITFWLNPVQKKWINKQELHQQIYHQAKTKLKTTFPGGQVQRLTDEEKEKLKATIKSLVNQTVDSLGDHLALTTPVAKETLSDALIKKALEMHKLDPENYAFLLNIDYKAATDPSITVEKPPVFQKVSMFFATIGDLGSNIQFLHKSEILNIGRIAHRIGENIPVFRAITKVSEQAITAGFKTACGGIAAIGLTVYTTYNITQLSKACKALKEEEEKAEKDVTKIQKCATKVQKAKWNLFTSSLDCFVATASFSALILGASTGGGILFLAFAAKSLGFVSLLILPE
jgi:hypothetical protein